MKFILASALLVIGVCAQHDHTHSGNHEHHRVNVDVYYESLCPDSRKFFNQQLYPSLQGELKQFVNLTLVPYGKSTTESNLGNLVFKCHHGDIECYGNKLHACALHNIERGNNTMGLGFNKVATGFVNCLMDKSVKKEDQEPQMSFPSNDCANLNQVPNVNIIDNCAKHHDGSTYLAQAGNMTDMLMKPLKSVPTIVFDKIYKMEDSQMAQKNFVKALCQYIKMSPKPATCLENSAYTKEISVTAILLAFVLSKFVF
ncbi:unnamed protein product [Brassicogethes aeneus]|uniref:Gamma-interferon-inducible lysosomal thiol reductase n=1 Tax=Brassicogethes aeneus TaxID=1431903 RepID=A0A9P0AU65_BRAAE|nr:unnamed protein product [Brassicogethes aeneus]